MFIGRHSGDILYELNDSIGGMKQWLMLGVSVLVAVLVESSLVAVPVVVWLLWSWSKLLSWKQLLWLGLVVGVLLDVLVVRNVGVSSLGLLLFIVVLYLVRTVVKDVRAEWLMLVVVSIGWSWRMEGVVSARGMVGVLVALVLWLGLGSWLGRNDDLILR